MQTQRQQQMFTVRKRSANAASATNVFCAKAKLQRQLRQGEIDCNCKFIFTIVYKALHSFTSLLRTVYTTSTISHYSKGCKTNNYKNVSDGGK
ncbi:hypothetical protein [Lysinibacillus agricola]|uniref:hypothetical protein n=1 Tax=Lysinibacillus agricola TaxID=2590012 RepID=UPI003C15C23B